MKRIVWLLVLLVLLLLIFLVSLFFTSQSDTGQTKNLAFPEAGEVVRTNTATESQVKPENFRLSIERDTPFPGYTGTGSTSENAFVPYRLTTYVPYTPSNTSSVSPKPSGAVDVHPSVARVITGATNASSTVATGFPFTLPNQTTIRIPTIVPPPYPTPYYIPPPAGATEPVVVGRSRGGDDITFDPESGDLFVGETRFNFRGSNLLPNQGTSNIVGDPDNLVVGSNLGLFVGSLLGSPSLGLLFGTAMGSNLYNGFTLSDFGIGLQDGLLTINGQDLIGEMLGGSGIGDILGDTGLGEIAGGVGGGNDYFGGRTFAFPCTCTADKSFFLVTDPSQYMGTYLYTAGDSKAYNNYQFFGYFNTLGSYTPNEGSGECEMYVVEDCIELEITQGALNDDPGHGTSAPF